MKAHFASVITLCLLCLMAYGIASAGQPCAENFAQSGDWTSGKKFTSWVETPGNDTSKAFLAIGRAIGAEGFSGISASKDLGLISAYQDNNGKRSTLNALVSQSRPGTIRVHLTFQLAPGLSTSSSAIEHEFCKLLSSVLPESERAAASSAGSILIGKTPVSFVAGTLRRAGVFPVLLIFSDYEGTHAACQTRDPRPRVQLVGSHDPDHKYLLVRLEIEHRENKRSLKMLSAKKLFRAIFKGNVDYQPDKDWTIPLTSRRDASGKWVLTPAKDLTPGEYGLWDTDGKLLAPFEVDPPLHKG